MALLTKEIGGILANKGLITFPSEIGIQEPGTHSLGDARGHVDTFYKRNKLTVNSSANTITLSRVSNDADEYNCVNIITHSDAAIIGNVGLPGYVFTDMFSGCVFYLYENGPNQVTGVHAHNGLETTTRTTGWWRFKRTIVNRVVREYGPGDFMTATGQKMLCRHETRLVMTDKEKSEMNFLGFLSCVEKTGATTYLFCYAGSREGSKVGRLIETYQDRF